jgi:signal transduction histidine kinase
MTDMERAGLEAKAIVACAVIAFSLLPLTGGGTFFIENFTTDYLISLSLITSLWMLLIAGIPNRLLVQKVEPLIRELEQRKVFVRHISHEIRTPLNTMSIGLKLLIERLEAQRQNDNTYALSLATDLRESCSVAIGILSRILDYEKLVDSLMTLECAWIDPLPFLTQTLRPFFILAASIYHLTIRHGESRWEIGFRYSSMR